MKNKRETEDLRRKTHIAQKNLAKEKRRQEPSLARNVPNSEEKPKILVVCCGKNTEPSYFKKFRLSSMEIVTIPIPFDPSQMVDVTIRRFLSNQGTMPTNPYEQIWIVFDKDDFPYSNFDNAVFRARSNHIKVAYSNQAFEYWLILHFEAHQGGSMPRAGYNTRINQFLNPFGVSYDGNGSKIIEDAFFFVLMSIESGNKRNLRKVDLAIERANNIYSSLDHSSPAKNESSTSVFELVRELLKYE